MGRIVVSENVTLDGVVGDKDREGWAEIGLDEALGADAFLLGRRSYEFLDRRVSPGAMSRADAAGTYQCSFNGGIPA